jgi:hypothetical protein
MKTIPAPEAIHLKKSINPKYLFVCKQFKSYFICAPRTSTFQFQLLSCLPAFFSSIIPCSLSVQSVADISALLAILKYILSSSHIEQTYLLGYWPYKSYKKRYIFKVYIVKKKTRKGHTPPKDYIFELLSFTFFKLFSFKKM